MSIRKKFHIVQESVGCMLQDPFLHVYDTSVPDKLMKRLFIGLLSDAGYSQEKIKSIKDEIEQYEDYEDDNCQYSNIESYVDFDDIYNTRTYLRRA